MADHDHEHLVVVRVPCFGHGDETDERRMLQGLLRGLGTFKKGCTAQVWPDLGNHEGGQWWSLDPKGGNGFGHLVTVEATVDISAPATVEELTYGAVVVADDPEFGWTHLCEESPDSPGWCAYHRSYCTADGPGPHVTDHPE